MPTSLDSFVGTTFGSLMDQLELKPGDLTMIDEPPGVLKAVSLITPKDTQRARIVVRFERQSCVFSRDREWPIDKIRQSKIDRITFGNEYDD